MIPLIIQLISGAVGGNIAGAILKNLNLGPIGNSIAGIVGGDWWTAIEHGDIERRCIRCRGCDKFWPRHVFHSFQRWRWRGWGRYRDGHCRPD
jgi:hypothetical protein